MLTATESHLATFIREHDEQTKLSKQAKQPTKPTKPMQSPESSSAPSTRPHPPLEQGVQDLHDTIDRTMQSQWEAFQKQYHTHWQTFNTDYIQPSIAFLGEERKRMDNEHQQLMKSYEAAQNKCTDLERYNTLLQEKIAAVEQEMKSFLNLVESPL